MPVKLPDSRQALADYLDEMLHQATSQTALQPPVDDETPVYLPGEAPAEAEDEQSSTAPVEVPPAANTASELEFPLQCLMFRVGGHLLSVPLIQLSSVVDWNEAITRLPESPPWLLGLVKHRDLNLRVVDSRQLLEIDTSVADAPAHLLVLEESGWAITCDQLEQVVNIERADVQWKAGQSNRMVQGRIRDSLSTLLHPPGIAQELDSRTAAGK